MSTHQSTPVKKRSTRFFVWGTPLLFALVILVQTSAFRSSKSPTFDESRFLNCALTTVKNGAIDKRICGAGTAPIPILINYLPPAWIAGGEERKQDWQGEISDPPLIDQARLINSLLVGIPTMLLIYIWLYRRRGYTAGFLGAALVTLSPTMMAHFSLATTDAGFTLAALIALATLTLYWKNPTKKNLFWLALTVSIAISSKYTGIFLFPCTLIIMSLIALQQISVFSKKSFWILFKRVSVSFLLFLLLTIPLTWALHLFSFTGPLKTVAYADTPDYSAWVRVLGRGPVAQQIMEVSHSHLKRPAPFAGILFQILHNSAGHDAYLMGDVSLFGWWYYFPISWILKSTPIELLMTILGLILGVFFIRGVWKTIRSTTDDSSGSLAEENTVGGSNEPTNHAPIIWLIAAAILLFMLL
ncbi:MAG: glycosyltransferase family 39 protein, partial [Gimesia sp.]